MSDDLPSRNKAFEFYEGPEGRRLLRSKRLLASVERDLLEFGLEHGFRVEENPERGTFCVTVNLEAKPVRYRRTCYLTGDELRRLKRNPVLRTKIDAGEWRFHGD